MLYLIILFLLVFASFFDINLKLNANTLLLYVILTVVLVLVAGLRNVGYDLDNYKVIFDELSFTNSNNELLDSLTEPGFSLLTKSFNALGISFFVLSFLFALGGVTLKSAFFLKYSDFPFVSLVIYFSIAYLIKDMGQIRHGMAMGLVLTGFIYLFKRKPLYFFLMVALASLIHASAVVALPVYWLVKIKIKPIYLSLSLLALFPLLFFDLRPVFISGLGFLSIPQIQSKATFYLYSDEFGSPLGLNISLILRLVVYFIMLLFIEKGTQRHYFYPDLVKLYYFGLLLYIIFNSVSDFAIRSSDYFKILDCIILPFFITLGKTRVEKNILWALVLIYSGWSVFKLFTDPNFQNDYLPYRTFFS